jgi:hypothetical protein
MGDAMSRADLREYLTANMLDGQEAGRITFDATAFLNEVVDNVMAWLAERVYISAADESATDTS